MKGGGKEERSEGKGRGRTEEKGRGKGWEGRNKIVFIHKHHDNLHF